MLFDLALDFCCCRQDASKREFSPEMRSILEVIAATGQYW
jgi:hypothetical protein